MHKKRIGIKIMWMLKAILASYIITGVLLLCLTFLVYQLDWKEEVVVASIVTIYVVSTFVGGIIIGKLMKQRRFLWGMILGGIYVALLAGVSYGIYREISSNGLHILTTCILCLGGGTLGGMAS